MQDCVVAMEGWSAKQERAEARPHRAPKEPGPWRDGEAWGTSHELAGRPHSPGMGGWVGVPAVGPHWKDVSAPCLPPTPAAPSSAMPAGTRGQHQAGPSCPEVVLKA